MTHFFAGAHARLFGGRLAVNGRYRPRQGGDIDLLKSASHGLVAVTDADFDAGLDRLTQKAPRLVHDVPAAAFAAAGVTPAARDTVVIDGTSYMVRSVERRDDGLTWRLALGETS